ncbi:pentapeptide repeat-containing protein [Arthrobacter sp. AET 35A]|uniref:pentapeptide repeat-containing protein n=1 Tax=Arthrobacter sp. 147(2020) TaxID=2735318 RepID=UPI00149105A2|nr:pentapeptide repeat-containing protein [Arthrobacter sp. 147(2020)]MBE0010548.1 pentapeptide repeat-containing protein [Arthrobacter sp. AET 35A]NOJ64356.1 pentapeptide repeat-containing protein [Arthrobacter sp. 147(2020)]
MAAAVLVAIAATLVLSWILDIGTRKVQPTELTTTVLTIVAGVGGVVFLVVAYRKQRDLESGRFVEHFGAAAQQLGHPDPAVRMAGVYAMAGVADQVHGLKRQQCIDVLCGYLRLPYSADTGANHQHQLVVRRLSGDLRPEIEEHHSYRQNDRVVRQTIVSVITAHLQQTADISWSPYNFDFRKAVFEDAYFQGAWFTGEETLFNGTHFIGEETLFNGAHFTGTGVWFNGARFTSNYTRFDGAHFTSNYTLFSEVHFAGNHTLFSEAHFAGDYTHFDGAHFAATDTLFSKADFTGTDTRFVGAQFTGKTTHFIETSFTGQNISFAEAQFAGKYTMLTGAQFTGEKTHFRRAHFVGEKTYFWGAHFTGEYISFGEAQFTGEYISFSEAQFTGETSFIGAHFTGPTSFSPVDFGAKLVSFVDPKMWDPPPKFDWDDDPTSKPTNVEPADWPPVVKDDE